MATEAAQATGRGTLVQEVTVTWTSDVVFKIEQEEAELDDSKMDAWVNNVDLQLRKKYGNVLPPNLTAVELRLSHNQIGDTGMCAVIDFLRRRSIAVEKLKVHRNCLGDKAAKAIGQWLMEAPKQVQEIHLSHNVVGDEGAVGLFEGVVKSGKYPCLPKENSTHLMPVWLRMECNSINWPAVWATLKAKNLEVPFEVAKSRDCCPVRDNPPMVCMHKSWEKQNLELTQGSDDGDASVPAEHACVTESVERHRGSKPFGGGVAREEKATSWPQSDPHDPAAQLHQLLGQVLPRGANIRVVKEGDGGTSCGASAQAEHSSPQFSARPSPETTVLGGAWCRPFPPGPINAEAMQSSPSKTKKSGANKINPIRALGV
mmetsp:Transcript_47320/g.106369  ORF Transcript_47320/g.106369 Transcript_47320/m.106369 type:complete len:373 (-) Transcript_47320:61-1179(-)